MEEQKVKQVKEIKVVCHRCKYEWTYRGIKLAHLGKYPVFAQCPGCKTFTKVHLEKEEDKS